MPRARARRSRLTETVPLRPRQLALAAIELCVQHGEKKKLLEHPMLGEVLNAYCLEEEGGWMLVGENLNAVSRIRVEVDASEHTDGFLSSRGTLYTQDILPPRSAALMVLSIDMRKKRHVFALGFGGALDPRGARRGPHPVARRPGPAQLHDSASDGRGGEALAGRLRRHACRRRDVASLAASIKKNMQPRAVTRCERPRALLNASRRRVIVAAEGFFPMESGGVGEYHYLV